MPSIFNDPELNPNIPEVELRIISTRVVAKTRKLNVTWGPKRRYIDVVERLAAIQAGKPDPGEWETLGPDPAEDLKILFHPHYGEKHGPEA